MRTIMNDVIQEMSSELFTIDSDRSDQHQMLTIKRAKRLYELKWTDNVMWPEHPNSTADLTRWGLKMYGVMGLYDLSLLSVVGNQQIGGSVLLAHGDEEQIKRWQDEINTASKFYTFGMTELGAGSDLHRLGTKAIWNTDTRSFTLSTPLPTHRKCWIGNSPTFGDICMVLARVHANDVDHGLHWFRVSLKLPGVVVEEMGKKIGCDGLKVGLLTFNNVELQEHDMCRRWASFDVNGQYQSPLTQRERFQKFIGTFFMERLGIAMGANYGHVGAVYITAKYGSMRTTFDHTLLEYNDVALRLAPHMSTAVAGRALIHHVCEQLIQERANRSKDSHIKVCLTKAFVTWNAVKAAQECRELCGGHGYLRKNQVGQARNNLDLTLTFGGDNTILSLEAAKCFMKEWLKEHPSKWAKLKFILQTRLEGLRLKSKSAPMLNELILHRRDALLCSILKSEKVDMTAIGPTLKTLARSLYDAYCIQVLHSNQDEWNELFAYQTVIEHGAWYLARDYIRPKYWKRLLKRHEALCVSMVKQYDRFAKDLELPLELIHAPIAHVDGLTQFKPSNHDAPY